MNENYYQTLKNGLKVLDFKKIAALNHRINIILSERGAQGKTFNIKEYILERWLKYKEKAVWVVNSQNQVLTGKVRFLTNNLKHNKAWANFGVDEHGVYFYDRKDNSHRKIGRTYIIYFTAIVNAAKQKTSRDDAVTTFVYDEFNEEIAHVWHVQCNNFDSIVHSYQVPQAPNEKTKIFIFGNQKGVAIPILKRFGFLKLEGEESVKKLGSNLTSWLYVPVKHEQEIKRLQKYWLFQMSTALDTMEQSFLNKSIDENVKGVIEIPKKIPFKKWLWMHKFEFKHQYMFNSGLYSLYYSSGYKRYLFVTDDNIKHPLHYVLQADKDMGMFFDKLFPAKFRILLAKEVVLFDSIFTKSDLRLI